MPEAEGAGLTSFHPSILPSFFLPSLLLLKTGGLPTKTSKRADPNDMIKKSFRVNIYKGYPMRILCCVRCFVWDGTRVDGTRGARVQAAEL